MRVLNIKTDHPHVPEEYIKEACGLLPVWVAEYDKDSDDNLKSYLETRYGWQISNEFFKGTVADDGVYSTPRYAEEDDGDEPLVPLGSMVTPDGTVYFYEYGMIGIPQGDTYFVTRMD